MKKTLDPDIPQNEEYAAPSIAPPSRKYDDNERDQYVYELVENGIHGTSVSSSTQKRAFLTGQSLPSIDAESAKHLFNCYHCHKSINSLSSYCAIMYFKADPLTTSYKNFHEHCFEEIAGKEYIK